MNPFSEPSDEMMEPNQPKVSGISFDNYVTFVQNKKRELVKEFIR
jgi:hypothetical protein